MMNKWKKIIMAILCLFIGVGIAIQTKMTDGERLYVSAKTVSDYQSAIEAEKIAVTDVEKLTQEAEEKLKYYKTDHDKKMKKTLAQDLEKNQIMAGTVDVKGPGIVVVVDDGTGKLKKGQNPNDLLIHDKDIFRVLNDLKESGAEVLSVNGQRILGTTAISCAGYTVRINGKTYARPFIVKAIGDSSKMVDRLMGVGGYGAELQNWGLKFDITPVEKIEIKAYNQPQVLRYLEEAKARENR
ncbi:MAG: DUF881 domain-containing protein [Anaerovoracaceae bacterium]